MTDETAAARKKKPNSPKSPGSSLRAAVSDVSKVYQQYSHGSFSRSEMASALGMSSGSGSFLGKAATLKEYGLITETGGSARVSDLFKSMYAAAAGSPDQRRYAWQAVRAPQVFARLLQQLARASRTKPPSPCAWRAKSGSTRSALAPWRWRSARR